MINSIINKIAYISDQRLSVHGIPHALRYMFPAAEINPISPHHLQSHIIEQYDLLILPGIVNEDSPYPEFLSLHKIKTLKQNIENNGLILWTLCAASYYMFDEMSYQKRNGEFINAKGSGLISGHANHAFNALTRRILNASPWDDYVLARLEINGYDKLLNILNYNGPAFFPEQQKDGLVKIFMKYQNVKDAAAGVTKEMGKGLILALGVHPELSPTHHNLPPHFARAEGNRCTALSLIRNCIIAHKLQYV